MINFEKYKNEVLELGGTFAVDKCSGRVDVCFLVGCGDCKFHHKEMSCRTMTLRWLYEEYVEPTVDWSKVPIDTKVLVSESGTTWGKRHFAGVNSIGNPIVYPEGTTSWSAGDILNRAAYKYTKLAAED